MNAATEQDLQRLARRRVKQKMGFYIHATVYLLVNLGLAAINFASGGKAWSLWPLAGWGLGLAIHGFVTFASLNGDGLRERMLNDEVERLRRKQGR
jgi:2TM domain